jgi:Condensation domain/Phthiocerol/phthiodiolone dimycocerosyl transferase C-terminus
MAKTARQIARDVDTLQPAGKVATLNRELGPLDHMFWLIDQNRSVHFAVVAQLAGRASPYDWREALDLLQDRHPILSVRIEGYPGSVPRFRQEDATPIPLRIVEGDPKLRWEREVSEELATPFDPSRAPLIRAVLIQSNRHTAFILVAHHSIADGLSLAYAIRDTRVAVCGGSLPRLPSSPSQEELLVARARPITLANVAEQQHDAPAGRPGTYRARQCSPDCEESPSPIDSDSEASRRARQEGTTVHGAFSAVIVLAGRQVFADWQKIPVRIMSPINIRPMLAVGERCGVFVSATTGVFDGRGRDFWELARDAKNAIGAGQTSDWVAALQARLQEVVGEGAEVAPAAEFAASAFVHEAMLTNLGVLGFDSQFGPLKVEEVWGPAVLDGMVGEHTIGVATVNGSICLTHTSHTLLLEAMQSVLVKACQ